MGMKVVKDWGRDEVLHGETLLDPPAHDGGGEIGNDLGVRFQKRHIVVEFFRRVAVSGVDIKMHEFG